MSLLSTFFHMLKWLTYVNLWLSTQISFWQNMPKKKVHMSQGIYRDKISC